jgi:hypothetical protein
MKKYCIQNRRPKNSHACVPLKSTGTDTKESIPGLLKRLQIRAQHTSRPPGRLMLTTPPILHISFISFMMSIPKMNYDPVVARMTP